MPNPPTDVSAAELFFRALDREDPHLEVEFPRAGMGKVRLHLLPDRDVKKAKLKALEEARKQIKDEDRNNDLAKELEGDLVACNILARSVRHTEPAAGSNPDHPQYPYIFGTSDAVSAKLTAHEIACLFAEYLHLQRKFGPGEHDFANDDEVNAWILRLKEGAELTPFWRLDWHALADLFQSLAKRACCLSNVLSSPPEKLPSYLASLPIGYVFDTSSAGSPQDELFQESETDSPNVTVEQSRKALDSI